jgi:hypothetical protein
MEWQKAFDQVKWTKVMQILKGTCIDWRQRLIGKFCMDQSIELKPGQGETRSMKAGRRVRKECCLSPILFTFYCEYLTKEALEGPGDFSIGGQVIRTVRYGDDLVKSPRKKRCNGT